jgi:hypothetical protein
MKYKKLFGICQTPGNMDMAIQYVAKAIIIEIGQKTAEIKTIPAILNILFTVYLWGCPWAFQEGGLRQSRCL